MRKLYTIFIFSVLIVAACDKNNAVSSPDFLSFGQDTVLFDTVFTARGTATRIFKVYNQSKSILKINRIALKNPDTFFRFNIDGFSGTQVKDLEILPDDSAFVFMDANIDPNGSNSPLVIEDALVFDFGDAQKELPIVAYGQDANYITPNLFINGLPPLSLLDTNTTWTAQKPYVVFGYAVVDSTFSLTIEPGAKVYFHSGGGLWIYRDGDLTAKGTPENPILFQGDRLEAFYNDLPGQWDRIWINEGARDVEIENVLIKNALFGIQAETLPFAYNAEAPTSQRTLSLNNVIIKNCSGSGLLLRNFRVNAKNVELSNCGQYTVAITGGGSYNFNHISSANYWNDAVRKTPSFFATNAFEDIRGIIQIRDIESIDIQNSFFVGNNDSEFETETIEPGSITLNLNFSALATENANDFAGGSQLLFNPQPRFIDRSAADYRLDSDSPFINRGTGSSVNFDLLLRPRDGQPDLGAYEFNSGDLE